ncbi:hypothetical protein EVAR_92676_1 [Eumeta japonica]|uniref:Uncharacterized protein n=1 Tax=Eumeta variegata TaxID=151549 RepID=A0A4C1SXT8_EUMVA|nr:hypothetical protein EVAR_92676_1 [Eumeta japonica]
MILHCFTSTDIDISQLCGRSNRYIDCLFIRYVHKYRYSSVRGTREVGGSSFATFPKPSRSLGAGHWGTCAWPIAPSVTIAVIYTSGWLVHELRPTYQSNSVKVHVKTVHLKEPAPYVSRNRLKRTGRRAAVPAQSLDADDPDHSTEPAQSHTDTAFY